MCGIAGAIKLGTGRLTIKSLKAMAIGIEKRGRHAFGVAWIDCDNHLHRFKSEGKISDNLEIFDRMHDCKAVVIHTRFSTHGDPSDNVNNHPHPVDGGWLVHNGQIPNHTDLTDEFDLLRSTECDSEVLGLMIQHLEGTLVKRTIETVNLCDNDMPLSMAGIWNRPNRVVVVKRGNPLVMAKGSTGNMYFSSVVEGMPVRRMVCKDNTVWCFDVTTGSVKQWTKELYPYAPKKGVKILGSTTFDDDLDSKSKSTHRVAFSWESTTTEEDQHDCGNLWEDVQEDQQIEEMDKELKQFTKARNNLSPARQRSLDTLLERSGEASHDGVQYINGRRVRYIKPDQKKLTKAQKRKARKAKKRKAKQQSL